MWCTVFKTAVGQVRAVLGRFDSYASPPVLVPLESQLTTVGELKAWKSTDNVGDLSLGNQPITVGDLKSWKSTDNGWRSEVLEINR